jgi:hypothetical protein
MYQQMIRESMARTGAIAKADPRHVEAWMRESHYTLDALSPQEFTAAVVDALGCIAESGREMSEQLAAAVGL